MAPGVEPGLRKLRPRVALFTGAENCADRYQACSNEERGELFDSVPKRQRQCQQVRSVSGFQREPVWCGTRLQDSATRRQALGYDSLLTLYRAQVMAGQLSVINYLTVLGSRAELQQDMAAIAYHRELLVNEYNYWNW